MCLDTGAMKHYYEKKYPYLQYRYTDTDGECIMFSVPPKFLSLYYQNYFGKKPETFFDCGAATGVVVKLAMDAGMDARGIDIKKYPEQHQTNFLMKSGNMLIRYPNAGIPELFKSGRVEIKSIMDCEPIKADIAYCNGALTYFPERQIPKVLSKFRNVGIFFAIHNTTEDIDAAKQMGQNLTTCNKTLTLRPNKWWNRVFAENGFDVDFNPILHCFVAVPKKSR